MSGLCWLVYTWLRLNGWTLECSLNKKDFDLRPLAVSTYTTIKYIYRLIRGYNDLHFNELAVFSLSRVNLISTPRLRLFCN